MAEIDSGTYPTLKDYAKVSAPKGSALIRIIEMLEQKNPILMRMPVRPTNQDYTHIIGVRQSLPSVQVLTINKGVAPSKSTAVQFTEDTGRIGAWADCDQHLAKLSGNVNAFRLKEEKAFIQALNNEMARLIFYGNKMVEPGTFNGFSVRYSSLSGDNAENIIDAGGVGNDNASIWIVVWGENSCYGIVPKNIPAGLQRKDLGEQVDRDSNGLKQQVYSSAYEWSLGLAVENWQYVVRICNVDRTKISPIFNNGTFAGDSPHLPNLLYKGMRQIKDLNMGTLAIYMSRDLLTDLQMQLAASMMSSTLTVQNVGGVWTEVFQGKYPIDTCDVLNTDEARVV